MNAVQQLMEREPDDIRDGQIEYYARSSIRDLIRLHGFEEARKRVAMYLNDEADRRPEWPRN
jgi:hypothetical protein